MPTRPGTLFQGQFLFIFQIYYGLNVLNIEDIHLSFLKLGRYGKEGVTQPMAQKSRLVSQHSTFSNFVSPKKPRHINVCI